MLTTGLSSFEESSLFYAPVSQLSELTRFEGKFLGERHFLSA
jgi:hypothetical protein